MRWRHSMTRVVCACVCGGTLLAVGSSSAWAQSSSSNGSNETGSQDNSESRSTDSNQERYVAFRAGGDTGYARIEGEDFGVLNAQALLRVWNFRFDFAAPLRINLARFGLRERDWDEARDFARIPQCLRLDLGDYDAPPDRFDPTCDPFDYSEGTFNRVYFSTRFSPINHLSFAEGTLVNSFRNSFDPDHPAMGMVTNFELWDWFKAHYILDDVTRPRVMGGRFSLWPMQIFSARDPDWSWDRRPDELEIAVTAMADLNAPLTVQSAFGRPIVDEQSNLRFNGTPIAALSFDVHYFYIFGYGDPSARWKFAVYGAIDYDRFLGVNDMDMFNAALRLVALNRADGWDIRAGVDYRSVGNRYIPAYFDANYSTNSQQFALTSDLQTILGNASLVTTKLGYALAQPEGRSHGFRAFASAEIPIPISRTERTTLPIRFFFEDSERRADATVLFGVGPLQIDQLVAGALVVRRNFEGFTDLFSLDGTLLRLFGRFFFGPQDSRRRRNNLLSNLYLSANYDRRWNLGQDGAFVVTNDVQATIGYSGGTQ